MTFHKTETLKRQSSAYDANVQMCIRDRRYAARIDYTLEPMQQRNFNFSYMFQYNDINIYEEGDRAYNTTYKYHLAEFGFSDVWYKNFRFGLGLRFEYYKYKDFLFKKPEISDLKVESEHFLSYLDVYKRQGQSSKGMH